MSEKNDVLVEQSERIEALELACKALVDMAKNDFGIRIPGRIQYYLKEAGIQWDTSDTKGTPYHHQCDHHHNSP